MTSTQTTPSAPTIDAGWIADALGVRGRINKASVARIGDGVGLVSQVLRVKLEHDGATLADNSPLPHSLIVKIPSSDPSVRAMITSLALHRREAEFYGGLARDLGRWIPNCYGVDKADVQAPTLLIEDVPARATTLQEPCSIEHAQEVLSCIAVMHARWWGATDEIAWAPGLASPERDILSSRLRALMPKFMDYWSGRATAPELAIAAQLPDTLDGLFTKLWAQAPETLIHFDVRLGNVLYGGPCGVFVVDWQTLSRGPAAFDVSYFLSSSIAAEDYEAHGAQLLKHYVSALRRHGVDSYSLQTLTNDVALASLPALAVAIVTSASVAEIVNEEGRLGLECWVERALAAASRCAGHIT